MRAMQTVRPRVALVHESISDRLALHPVGHLIQQTGQCCGIRDQGVRELDRENATLLADGHMQRSPASSTALSPGKLVTRSDIDSCTSVARAASDTWASHPSPCLDRCGFSGLRKLFNHFLLVIRLFHL